MLEKMPSVVDVNIELLDSQIQIPAYATDGASGADVRAHITEDLVLAPGKSMLIPTGLKFEIPQGFEIQVRPRSGLAFKSQITVLNTPATIDSDYRGELKVILINHGAQDFIINPNMRIAQIVFAPVVKAQFKVLESITSSTARGSGGFGHTGTF